VATGAAKDGTVARAVQLMRCLAEAEGEMTVKGLSAALALPPSTVHRLLDLLAGEGIVERDGKRHRYRVGSEFYRMAALVYHNVPIRSLALPIMHQVVEACGEVCFLTVYLPGEGKMMFSERVESPHALRYRPPPHRAVSVLWGASGRAILAFLPAEERERIIARETASPASGEPLPDPPALAQILAKIRADGVAVTHGQMVDAAVGIAAPVFDGSRRVIGSLGVTIPEIRYKRREEAALMRLTAEKAAELSGLLGHHGEPAAADRRRTG
jgi:DNA-binding IclR family transcriptional regulator